VISAAIIPASRKEKKFLQRIQETATAGVIKLEVEEPHEDQGDKRMSAEGNSRAGRAVSHHAAPAPASSVVRRRGTQKADRCGAVKSQVVRNSQPT